MLARCIIICLISSFEVCILIREVCKWKYRKKTNENVAVNSACYLMSTNVIKCAEMFVKFLWKEYCFSTAKINFKFQETLIIKSLNCFVLDLLSSRLPSIIFHLLLLIIPFLIYFSSTFGLIPVLFCFLALQLLDPRVMLLPPLYYHCLTEYSWRKHLHSTHLAHAAYIVNYLQFLCT